MINSYASTYPRVFIFLAFYCLLFATHFTFHFAQLRFMDHYQLQANGFWHFKTNSGVIAPPSTFEVGGVQYIAVASGYGVDPAYQELLLSELLPGWKSDIPQGGVIWVFAVGK